MNIYNKIRQILCVGEILCNKIDCFGPKSYMCFWTFTRISNHCRCSTWFYRNCNL